MERANLTETELENLISVKIQNFYLEYLKQELQEIFYQWQENQLIIVIEGTVTQTEQLLYEYDRKALAYRVRKIVDLVILPKIKQEIVTILGIRIADFLYDTTIQTGRTGVIVICELNADNSC